MTATTTTTTATSPPVTRPEYPIGVPNKFAPDGTVARFPGNTTICHLPSTSPLQPGLHALYNAIEQHPTLSSRIRLLPPSSWHMTVCEGMCESECEPGKWPPGKEKQPLNESNASFTSKLRALGESLAREGLAPPYRMRVRSFSPTIVGVGLEIEGATSEEEVRMRRLRDRLADTMGFRALNHEVYNFHLTVAYCLRHIEGKEKKEIGKLFSECWEGVGMEFELGAVEFCTFEDMTHFERVLYLE